MVFSVISNGIANQLYDYFFGYLFTERYGLDLSLLINSDYGRYSRYNCLCDLAIKETPIYTFHATYLAEKSNELNNFLVSFLTEELGTDSILVITEKDLLLEGGKWQLKDEGRLKHYEHILLNPFLFSNTELIRENLEILKPFWKLKNPVYEEYFSGLSATNCVAVHIRATMQIRWWGEEFCRNYFRAGIEWFRRKMPGCTFYIFSVEQDVAYRWLGVAEDLHYIEPHFQGVFGDLQELFFLSTIPNKLLSLGSTYSEMARLFCDCDKRTFIQGRSGRKDVLRGLLKNNDRSRHLMTDAAVRRLAAKYTKGFTEAAGHSPESIWERCLNEFYNYVDSENYVRASYYPLVLRNKYFNDETFHTYCLRLYQGLGFTNDVRIENSFLTDSHKAYSFVIPKARNVFADSTDVIEQIGHVLRRMGYPVVFIFEADTDPERLEEFSGSANHYRSEGWGGCRVYHRDLLQKEKPLTAAVSDIIKELRTQTDTEVVLLAKSADTLAAELYPDIHDCKKFLFDALEWEYCISDGCICLLSPDRFASILGNADALFTSSEEYLSRSDISTCRVPMLPSVTKESGDFSLLTQAAVPDSLMQYCEAILLKLAI